MSKFFRVLLGALALITAVSACYAANPPICPHVLGWNSTIATWAQGAPWIKVIYSSDVAPAKAVGAKVFYRPWDADSTNHDDGCLPSSQTGSQYADLVWAKISPMTAKPDAVGYRNEFNWTDPTCSKRTCQEFVNYASRLKSLGYTGKVIFGSFGVGWVDDGIWNDTDLTNAVNASDGVETHEYFDLQVNCGAPWYCFRHRDIALANHAYLRTKDWYIGEFGSDHCCNSDSCTDSQCRRGWQDRGKLTQQAYINEMTTYRAGCASQVVAVFVFQQGDSANWGAFEVLGTNVADWMRSTWGVSSGRFTGQVKDTNGNPIPYPTISVTPGLYGAATTDASGNYTTPYIPAGTYSITASKSGYGPQTFSRSLAAGPDTVVGFALSPLSGIGAAKQQASGTTAVVSGIVTARFPLIGSADRVYVEDPNRTSGIAVMPPSTAFPTDSVQVQGTLYTTTDGETILNNATLTPLASSQSLPKPFGLQGSWLGGAQFGLQGPVLNSSAAGRYAVGLNNVGLLCRVCGAVTYADPSGAFFYIEDGSGLDDGSTHTGLRVATTNLPAASPGTVVLVTGISSTMMINGKLVRVLKPRSACDLSYAGTSNYLLNTGFETGNLNNWTSYGRVDGAQSGTWFGSITAHSGSYFFGSAANYDSKTGGLYQRVIATRYARYQAKAWSRVYWSGNSSTSTQSRVGIDPTGGTNPAASSVSWSSVDTAPNSDSSKWNQLTTPIVTCTGNLITIFLDYTQTNPSGWHINCFDDAEIKLVP